MSKTAPKQQTLGERIYQIDAFQGKRFAKLEGVSREIAEEGILRHLRACTKMEVTPDVAALREIIDDALAGRRVFA